MRFVSTRGRQFRLPSSSEPLETNYLSTVKKLDQAVAFIALIFLSFHVDANHCFSLELFVLLPLAACLSPIDFFASSSFWLVLSHFLSAFYPFFPLTRLHDGPFILASSHLTPRRDNNPTGTQLPLQCADAAGENC